jgi:processive 1,2-diacylglycerol beta-glucosyltransferase/1,2-diacylglycerol 3-beta-galactosyltransferase
MSGEDVGRRFLLVYLNTGNGHRAQAKVLQEAFYEYAPECKVELLCGFDRKNRGGHVLLEQGYAVACNYLHGVWPLVYDLGEFKFFQTIVRHTIRLHTQSYLRKEIEGRQITDVVSFHFALTPVIHDAILTVQKRTGRKIRLTVITTDPFTGPSAWFYRKNQDYLVASPQFRDFAIRCGVPASRVRIVPFLLNKKFTSPVTKDEIRFLRGKYGYPQDKRVVLLAGGGEGLPGALKIVNQCVLHKAPFSVAVVCGRNKGLYRSLELVRKVAPWLDLHIYGFVDYMDSLVKLSDLIVSKAGTSTIMEIASQQKPVIISNYIYGQEKGNLEFVKRNGIGCFIRHSADIYARINGIFESGESYEKAAAACKGLVIDTDVKKTVRYLLGNRQGDQTKK